MVQDLAGVVKYGLRFLDSACGCARNDNLFQRHGLVVCTGNEFVQVINIALQVLAVVKLQGTGGDDGLERVDGIREIDQAEHRIMDLLSSEIQNSYSSPNLRSSKE